MYLVCQPPYASSEIIACPELQMRLASTSYRFARQVQAFSMHQISAMSPDLHATAVRDEDRAPYLIRVQQLSAATSCNLTIPEVIHLSGTVGSQAHMTCDP